MKSQNEIQISPEINLTTNEIQGNTRYIDFVFCVPSGYEPKLVGFKLNSIVEIPAGAIVSADQAPAVEPFSPSVSAPAQQNNNQPPARTQNQQRQQQTPPQRRGLSNTSRSVVGDELDE